MNYSIDFQNPVVFKYRFFSSYWGRYIIILFLKDEEQSIQEELEKLQFADRLSPFDSDLSSLERKFDESLHLAVRTTSDEWKLPEGEIIEGETLRKVWNSFSFFQFS